jgi:very-short-patch-repair endonuclease
MLKSKHFDFKVVKKHARELRGCMTDIELDGPIHETTSEYDEFRNSEMEFLGMHVLRLKNDDLLNMKETLLKIDNFLKSIP